MGSGIACISALAGHATTIIDREEQYAKKGVQKALEHAELLYQNGLTTSEALQNAQLLLTVSADRETACRDCGLMIEAIVENVEAKRALFLEIEPLLREDVPMLSNTSGLRITQICQGMRHPERALTAHFWFPAYLVPLVEVVMHDCSDPAVAFHVRNLLQSWGKAPVIVKRDQPGQLANRILQAMIREAVSIVESGLASAEDVDMAVKMGPGIRLPVWGILEHADAVGIDLVKSVQDTTLPDLERRTESGELLKEMLAANQLGVKTGVGFYDWSERSFSELEQLRNDMIITAVKVINAHKATLER